MTRQPTQLVDPCSDNVIPTKGYPYVKKKVKKFTTKKNGGHVVDIDPKQVEQLARLQCTLKEIASVFGVDESTIVRKFNSSIERGRLAGNADLRRAQYKKAVVDRNTAMLIWLGKQYLGQSEETRVQHTFEPDVRMLLDRWDTIDVKSPQAEIDIREVKRISKDAATFEKQYLDSLEPEDAILEPVKALPKPSRRGVDGRFVEDVALEERERNPIQIKIRS